MSKATDRFKNDPYVKDYYQKAQENQEIVNGLKDSGYMGSAPVETATPASPVPTPNEIGKTSAIICYLNIYSMRILIKNGWIVNEGRTFKGSIVIENDYIQSVLEDELDNTPRGTYDKEVDATGCFVCPGVIDSHVHFREPA